MEEIFYCPNCGHGRFEVTRSAKKSVMYEAVIDVKGCAHEKSSLSYDEEDEYKIEDGISCLNCGKISSLVSIAASPDSKVVKTGTWPEEFEPPEPSAVQHEVTKSYSLEDLISTQSLEQELSPKWRIWVCDPVLKYPMAPRYARAILEAAGKLLGSGSDIKRVLSLISDQPKPNFLPAGPERDKVLEEAKNYTDEDLVIYDDAKVEEVKDGYWVEAYVWVAKEVSDENL